MVRLVMKLPRVGDTADEVLVSSRYFSLENRYMRAPALRGRDRKAEIDFRRRRLVF